MYEYTQQNYFRFGYERPLFDGSDEFVRGKPYKERTTTFDRWWCEYQKVNVSRACSSWRTENTFTAMQIADYARRLGLVPELFFSGGIDSEVMVRAFMEANVNFLITIVMFEDRLNLHDISFAVSFCQSHGLPYRILEIDLLRFWNNIDPNTGRTMLDEIAILSKTFSPQLCEIIFSSLTIGHAGDKPGLKTTLPVFGSGEPHLVKRNEKWYLSEKERIASLYRAPMALDIPAIPAFFQYNPENTLAFMQSDAVLNNLYRTDLNDSTNAKFAIYSQSYPDLVYRPKYTGFELVQEEDGIHRRRLKETYGAYDDVVYTRLDEFGKIFS